MATHGAVASIITAMGGTGPHVSMSWKNVLGKLQWELRAAAVIPGEGEIETVFARDDPFDAKDAAFNKLHEQLTEMITANPKKQVWLTYEMPQWRQNTDHFGRLETLATENCEESPKFFISKETKTLLLQVICKGCTFRFKGGNHSDGLRDIVSNAHVKIQETVDEQGANAGELGADEAELIRLYRSGATFTIDSEYPITEYLFGYPQIKYREKH